MQINKDGLEELYQGLYKECLETIASIICSSLADEDKACQLEELLLKHRVIK